MVGSPKKRAFWDDNRDGFLINHLLKATRQGRKSDSGFKPDVWQEIQQNYNTKFAPRPPITTKQIQTRMQTLHKNYKAFRTLKDQSGFGWDDIQKIPTAPNDVWDQYLEKHPSAKPYRTQTLSHYIQLNDIYGKDLSTGIYAEGTVPEESHPASISSPSIQNEEDNLDPELRMNYSEDIEFENDPDDSILASDDNKMKRSRSIASFSIESRKKSRGSVAENAALTTADGMTFLGTSIKEAALVVPETRFDQCIQIVNQMRNDKLVGDASYFQIIQMFMDKEKYPALFYAMIPDLRLEWLARQGVLIDES